KSKEKADETSCGPYRVGQTNCGEGERNVCAASVRGGTDSAIAAGIEQSQANLRRALGWAVSCRGNRSAAKASVGSRRSDSRDSPAGTRNTEAGPPNHRRFVEHGEGPGRPGCPATDVECSIARG